MKLLEKSFPLIFVGLLLVTLLLSCNMFGSSGDDGPKLQDLPGKIVYSSDRGNETHLFLTDQEGTRQLTSGEGMEAGDYHASNPSFSPDGQWVVYASNRAAPWAAEVLYRVRTDGSGRQALKDANGELIVGNNPVFSPDGKQVAFNRAEIYEPAYYNEDIYVMELAGGQVRKLTENTAHDTHPTWSPEGNRIAFASGRDYVEADSMRWRQDLYVIDVDGSNLTRLTETGKVDIPRWSPDERYIAYAWQHIDPDIYLLDLESKKVVELTNLKAVGGPMWNHNGSWLLISGTTNEGVRVLQLISANTNSTKLLKEVELNSEDWKSITNVDWYNYQ